MNGFFILAKLPATDADGDGDASHDDTTVLRPNLGLSSRKEAIPPPAPKIAATGRALRPNIEGINDAMAWTIVDCRMCC